MLPAHFVAGGYVPFPVGKLRMEPFLRRGGLYGQGRELSSAADRVGLLRGKQQIATARANEEVQLFQIAAAGTVLLKLPVQKGLHIHVQRPGQRGQQGNIRRSAARLP